MFPLYKNWKFLNLKTFIGSTIDINFFDYIYCREFLAKLKGKFCTKNYKYPRITKANKNNLYFKPPKLVSC